MKNIFSFRFCLFGLLLLIFAGPASAQPQAIAAQPAANSATPPIAAQIQTLLTGTSTAAPAATQAVPAGTAAPAKAPAATGAAPATTAPATAATPAAADSDNDNAEPEETFGTKALNFIIDGFQFVAAQGKTFVDNFAALPEITSWLKLQTSDPKLQDHWRGLGDDILIVVCAPLLAAAFLEMALYWARAALRRRKPADGPRKFALVVGLFLLRLIPVIAFVVASLALLNQEVLHRVPRLVILNMIYALTIGRIVIALIRSLLVPNAPNLRFIPASTEQVTYAYGWLRAFAAAIIYGYFFIDMARIVRIPAAAITAFINILGLALVLMTLIAIVQNRAFVAATLRGQLSAAQDDLTLFQSLRLWFARHWHILAVVYLVIGYLITALGVDNGLALMLRGTILTLVIFGVAWMSFHATERWGMRDTSNASAMHHTILRCLVRLVIWVFVIIATAAAWGANISAFFGTPLGQRLLGGTFSIGITVVIVAVVYEISSSAIERQLSRRDADGKQIQASARVRTLLPMIRNTIFILFAAAVTMVVLSEVGFNIGPLLAGAGIFGVAIGFGSQTLVKDFLTGLFIVIENTIAIGDVVKIGDHKGTVEGMSVRTLRLRDNDGALHILPFSEVTNLINMSRDYSYAVIDVGIAVKEQLQKMMDIVREVAEDMQKDPIYKRVILEPIQILGVESLTDSAVLLRSRLRTRPGKQWDVRRMFLMKVKLRMDAANIQPAPQPGAAAKPIPPL